MKTIEVNKDSLVPLQISPNAPLIVAILNPLLTALHASEIGHRKSSLRLTAESNTGSCMLLVVANPGDDEEIIATHEVAGIDSENMQFYMVDDGELVNADTYLKNQIK